MVNKKAKRQNNLPVPAGSLEKCCEIGNYKILTKEEMKYALDYRETGNVGQENL